jgi:hypothetical protein
LEPRPTHREYERKADVDFDRFEDRIDGKREKGEDYEYVRNEAKRIWD